MLTSKTLLVVLVASFCANIHCNSKEPQLVVGEAVKRWQGGFAGHLGGGETALDGRWWTPRLLLANKVEAKLRRKSLDNAWKKFLMGEPNILQRMARRAIK